MTTKALTPDQLYKSCNLEQLSFESSEELDDIDAILGQERAIEAIKFGLRVAKPGYNIFAMAPDGTGKLTTAMQLAEQEAHHQPVPFDWCYVHNFTQPAKPKAIHLEPGQGRGFQRDMAELIDELSVAIPAAFDGDEYRSRAGELENDSRQREVGEITKLRDEAEKAHIIFTETATGYAFLPADDNNEPLTPEQFNKLDKDRQRQFHDTVLDLQDRLRNAITKFPQWRKETKRKLQALNREVAELAVSHPIEELKQKYAKWQPILDYLLAVQKDIIEHVRDFIPHGEKVLSFMEVPQEPQPFKRYQVNLMVDLSHKRSAPVICEDLPNHGNLIGRIDHQAQMGSLVTDFTMIKPGVLHKANGGYLMIDARKLLQQPYAWETLKRTLKAGEIRIESLERALSLISTTSLEPEPIPLDIKVILLGDPILYYLLSYYDPEFQDFFKVAADFANSVDREHNCMEYARLLATIAKREKLRPLSRQAVARVIEHSARLADDAEKLLTHLRSIKDLLTEADHWAGENGHPLIANSDIQQAIDQKTRRSDRLRDRLYENIQRGIIMIASEGAVVGQINGLSVLQLGEFAFGQASRITATTRMGNGKVVDIERETELGGAIHSKGVMILSHFIAARYARNTPFSMVASLVFEQSYGHIEGDSASLAELCAILSSLAQVPLRQDLALTGSVNQLGQAQPIGGVNEKIEGFFDICHARGLSGSQGVIIPASNVAHLMLRWDVVHAAQAGQFHIYAIETVDEAVSLLSGIDAGAADSDGQFPVESFNGKIDAQLRNFTGLMKAFTSRENPEK
ncbi:MAG: AAA family ATPase [Methylomonas sp.]|jgi:lon-related putative ATP-dependent protease|uniref:Lon protease family protein n=1 Tax=Methylomonas sp. TaxID=418 RepID=UPI0025E81CB9|nr:ATP-binding protein [Methylomonas sp.]MCK9606527.1 AAA family ATPase [Methylomonas sp.]